MIAFQRCAQKGETNMLTKERTVVTSISLEPSKIDFLKRKAFEGGYKSRNDLIYSILTNWTQTEKESA